MTDLELLEQSCCEEELRHALTYQDITADNISQLISRTVEDYLGLDTDFPFTALCRYFPQFETLIRRHQLLT